MKIAFYVAHFSLRGTEVATFDYAHYAEQLLGHNSVIIAQSGHPSSEEGVEARFRARFDVKTVADFSEVDRVVEQTGADLFYILKAGERDGRVVRAAPTAVHAVFPTSRRDIHGDRFAFISQWLSERCSGGATPYVPHIVNMPSPSGDLRAALGIPGDAVVFGCYGGRESFDIRAAQNAVVAILQRRPAAYFISLNIAPFTNHPRAIFLPGSADPQYKSDFIATTDAMLHARHLGESFGIACGEFAILGKPVITYAYSPQRNHISVLGRDAILYRSQAHLEAILGNFLPTANRARDRYSSQFSPSAVMRAFAEAFVAERPEPAIGLHAFRHLASRVQSRVVAWQDAHAL